jgi:hypothetical protein
MAYGVVHRFPGGTREQYEASLAKVHPNGGADLPAWRPTARTSKSTCNPPRLTKVVTAEVTAEHDGTYAARWIVEGPVPLSEEDTRILLPGATTVTGGKVVLSSDDTTTIRATLDTSPLSVGSWRVGLVLTEVVEEAGKGRAAERHLPGLRSLQGDTARGGRSEAPGDPTALTQARSRGTSPKGEHARGTRELDDRPRPGAGGGRRTHA